MKLNLLEFEDKGEIALVTDRGQKILCEDIGSLRDTIQALPAGSYVAMSGEIVRPFTIESIDPEPEIYDDLEEPGNGDASLYRTMQQISAAENERVRAHYQAMSSLMEQSHARTLELVYQNERVLDERLRVMLEASRGQTAPSVTAPESILSTLFQALQVFAQQQKAGGEGNGFSIPPDSAIH